MASTVGSLRSQSGEKVDFSLRGGGAAPASARLCIGKQRFGDGRLRRPGTHADATVSAAGRAARAMVALPRSALPLAAAEQKNSVKPRCYPCRARGCRRTRAARRQGDAASESHGSRHS
jgi:hypothetical protein